MATTKGTTSIAGPWGRSKAEGVKIQGKLGLGQELQIRVNETGTYYRIVPRRTLAAEHRRNISRGMRRAG